MHARSAGLALLLAAGFGGVVLAAAPGERIYRDGVLPNGERLIGRVSGDVPLAGDHAACVGCHRRSGQGLADSEVLVPAVTGPALLTSREPRRADLLRGLYQEVHSAPVWAQERSPKARPAYTLETFKAALRNGVDPTGRALSEAMPRYAIDDGAAEDLFAYLNQLGAGSAPGVTETAIDFATISAGPVDPRVETAMLAVMQAYITRFNHEVARERDRPAFSPYYKSELRTALRSWRLHLWKLDGDPATWPDQLARHYEATPVFSVLAGIAAGPWDPIAAFCEQVGVPCLFPNTNLPPTGPPSYETLYLSRGVAQEAEALAQYLVAQSQATCVLQLIRDDPEAVRAAASGAGQVTTNTAPVGQPLRAVGQNASAIIL